MFLRCSLAHISYIYVNLFSVGTFGGLAPPPPPDTEKLATPLLLCMTAALNNLLVDHHPPDPPNFAHSDYHYCLFPNTK